MLSAIQLWFLSVPLVLAQIGTVEIETQRPKDTDIFANPFTLYSIRELPLLNTSGSGPDTTEANDINNRGEIVGWAETGRLLMYNTYNERHPALWRNNSVQSLQNPAFSDAYVATRINNLSEVIVYSFARRFGPGYAIWNNGNYTYPPDFTGACQPGQACGPTVTSYADLNDRQQIVGNKIYIWLSQNYPLLWQNNTVTALSPASANGYAGPKAVNNLGLAVGDGGSSFNVSQAVLWLGGRVIQLGTLGGSNGVAEEINDLGQIVGKSQSADGYYRATLWNNGAIEDISPNSNRSSTAVDINNVGQAIGNSIGGDLPESGFLYEKGRSIPLIDLISSNPGWTELSARGINDAGQIVGTGVIGGKRRAFLMSIK